MNRSGLKRTRERRDEISSNNERDLRDASVDSSQTAGTPHNYDLRSKRMKKEVIGESSDVCSKTSTEENDESKETCGGIAGCEPVSKSGDHVINKDVLKVYEAIVKSFVEKVFPGQNFVNMK